MFLDPYGNDFNHIRRLPFAAKDQERYSYEALLEKNEIPANYMRLQLEAVQFRKECDEYLETERQNIQSVLDRYDENPNLSRKELGVAVYEGLTEEDPLKESEVICMRKYLKNI